MDQLQSVFPDMDKKEVYKRIMQFKSCEDIVGMAVNKIMEERDQGENSLNKAQSNGSVESTLDDENSKNNEDMVSKIGKLFGFWGESKVKAPIVPPSGSQSTIEAKPPQLPPRTADNNITATNIEKPTPIEDMSINSALMKKSLHNSIRSLQSADGNINNTIPMDNPTLPAAVVNEQCKSVSQSSLRHHDTIQGLKVFINVLSVDSLIGVLDQKRNHVLRFIKLLTEICHVFEIPSHLMHIFFEESGTIGFNRGKALFMNIKFFFALHCTSDEDNSQAYIYWYMVICHELAHNFIAAHDAAHENYLSSFAETYLVKFMALLNGKPNMNES